MQRFSLINKSIKLALLLFAWQAAEASAQTLDARPYFKVGQGGAAVKAVLTKAQTDSLSELVANGKKIQIMGTASPEGVNSYNQRLATRRARAYMRQMKKATGLPDSVFSISTKVLSWDVLRDYVSQDGQVPEQQQVLSLLDDASGSQDGKDVAKKLKALAGGTPYLYIKEHVFPLMRTAVMSADDDAPQFSVEQSVRVSRQVDLSKLVARPSEKSVQAPGAKSKISSSDSIAENAVKKDTVGSQVATSGKSDVSDVGDAAADVSDAADGQGRQQLGVATADGVKSSVPRYLWFLVALLLCCLLALLLMGRRMLGRKEQELEDVRSALTHKEGEVRQLEQQLQQKDRELKQLRAEHEEQKEQMAEADKMFEEGRKLYQYIVDGGLAGHWTASQMKSFADYYRIVNPRLMDSLDKQYDQLPPSNLFYLVLVDMGKTDADIQKIMNISQTTIRSIRFRIKNKQRGSKEE